MTDKERSEEIDIKVDDLLNDRLELLNFVNDYYLQNDRVQELEEQKLALIEEMGQVDERFLESEHQNKKLREALEKIFINQTQVPTQYEKTSEIARKALEETE